MDFISRLVTLEQFGEILAPPSFWLLFSSPNVLISRRAFPGRLDFLVMFRYFNCLGTTFRAFYFFLCYIFMITIAYINHPFANSNEIFAKSFFTYNHNFLQKKHNIRFTRSAALWHCRSESDGYFTLMDSSGVHQHSYPHRIAPSSRVI